MPYRSRDRHRQKSRVAARCRRSREAEVLDDLTDNLPLPESIVTGLDKTAVIRVAIAFIRLRTLLGPKKCIKLEKGSEGSIDHLKMLGGFTMILTEGGDITFISDNVSKYLGITQADLIGQNIYEYTHPCDHSDLKDALPKTVQEDPKSEKEGAKEDSENHKSFSIRLKCTISSKGGSMSLKSAMYKVIQCTGCEVVYDKEKITGIPRDQQRVLVLACEPIFSPMSQPVYLDRASFMSQHSMDMKYTSVDNNVQNLLGYKRKDLIGKSAYHFHHVLDSHKVLKQYKDLFAKGQSVISGYRMMARDGGYCWMHTQATVICHPRTEKPQNVICINTVTTGVEDINEVLTVMQNSNKKNRELLDTQTGPASTANMVSSVIKQEPGVTVPITGLSLASGVELSDLCLDESCEDIIHLATIAATSPGPDLALSPETEPSFTPEVIVIDEEKDVEVSPSPSLVSAFELNRDYTSPQPANSLIEESRNHSDDIFLFEDMLDNFQDFVCETDNLLSLAEEDTLNQQLTTSQLPTLLGNKMLKRQLMDNPFMGAPAIKKLRPNTYCQPETSTILSSPTTPTSSLAISNLLEKGKEATGEASILKKLLMEGEDDCTGYTCINKSKISTNLKPLIKSTNCKGLSQHGSKSAKAVRSELLKWLACDDAGSIEVENDSELRKIMNFLSDPTNQDIQSSFIGIY